MSRTVLDCFLQQTETRRDALAYRFLVDGEREELRLTYAELETRTKAVAAALQARGAAGKRAVLLFAPGIDYLVAFYGCLAAGVIAVPAYPPDPVRLNRSLPRLRAMVADCQADIVLTTSDIHTMAQFIFQQAPELEEKSWIATDTIEPSMAASWRMPQLDAESTAFLQYTSGSTGSPKGVILSHGNLVHNLELITDAFHVDASTMGLSWLPPYHDMGLIGGILAPLYRGGATILMSPIAFLQKPYRWLEAISRLDVTISGGPNFAYELCLRKISAEERDTLDLSRWRLAFSGAEPVRAETVDRFVEAFAASGFRREAFYPCYGLAEATLIVSGGRVDAPPVVVEVDAARLARNRAVAAEDPTSGHSLVGCGAPLGDQRVAIVDPSTRRECGAGEIGEIWVAGGSISAGYWHNAKESERAFHNSLRDAPATRFLRTGDLGFLRDGELFVTGRLKDLIIIRGRNVYPQDLERTVEEAHPTLRRGCSAAFAVDLAGDEQIVVVVEVERRHHDRRRAEQGSGASERRGPDRRAATADAAVVERPMPFDEETIFAAIKAAVTDQHALEVRTIVLLKGGSIPKTSSGKIQRQECKKNFLDGSLEEVARQTTEGASIKLVPNISEEPPLSAEQVLSVRRPERQAYVETWLQTYIGRVLGREPESLPVAEPITRFGLDSVMAIELSHAVEKALGAILPVSTLLRDASIRDIAREAATTMGRSSTSTIPPRSTVAEEFPLSRGQQALWFMHQMDPVGPAYNLATAWRIDGLLDVNRLQSAFSAVVARHPMLFARFRDGAGGPAQRFALGQRFSFDLRDATDVDDQGMVAALTAAGREPFDLSRDVLRVVLFARRPDEHYLLLGAHHIALDFWSMVVVLEDLRAAFASGGALPPLLHDYRDFVRYQSMVLVSPAAEEARQYWKRRLGQDLPVLELPTDRPRGGSETHVGASHRFVIDSRLSTVVRSFARSEGRTLFTVLLAAFQACLCRWSGQDDVVVGTPLAGRARAGFDRVVGYFVNVLPVRARLSPGITFRDLVGQVRDAALEAIDHEDFPLLDIVNEVRPPRLPGRSALFQALFALEKSFKATSEASAHLAFGLTDRPFSLGSVSLQPIALDLGAAQFDVSLTCVDADGPITCILQYNTHLFDEATMATFARTFEVLLEHAVLSPDEPIARLEMVDSAIRRRVLVDWNATLRAGSLPPSLHGIVEAQVERTPDAVAVVVDDESVTFAELDRRATAVARALEERGAGPETIVGVCLPRSIEMLSSILGVLKAGAAYLPLDPSYPDRRLRLMMEDSGAPLLIAAASERARFADLPVRVLGPSDLQPTPELRRQRGRAVDPEGLAYVIYTSGSTGRPKGVQVRHGAVANLLMSMMEEPSLAPHEVVVGVTSLSFDVSVVDLFLPLAVGARVVIAKRETLIDGARLRDLVETVGADVMQATPSTWRLLLGAGWPAVRRLRAWCAGEALPESLAHAITSAGGELWNLYGPTETTVYSSGELVGAGPITIGRPIANSELYVLDERLEPVPPGVVGELWIGGHGVARGYLRRPELTAERFIPDPMGPQHGGRLYRTGDRVRHRADGRIEYIGRADHQIKLRGFRIELGEIEAALFRHPSVATTAVIVSDGDADRALVAYVVSRPNASPPTPQALRELLRRDLPDYMVPSFFVLLPHLPLTSNGKLDRAALPPPRVAAATPASTPPEGPLERLLGGIMREALRLDAVPVDVSFFDLGGHSLLATQVISRIEESLGVRPPVATLFEHSSVRSLSTWFSSRPDAASIIERAELVLQILEMSEEDAERALTEDAAGTG